VLVLLIAVIAADHEHAHEKRLYPRICYYKTKNGREVDSVVSTSGRKKRLVQVCESPADAQTRKRETTALSEAMDEQGLKTGTIITLDSNERIETGKGAIDVVPAWRFLLDLPDTVD